MDITTIRPGDRIIFKAATRDGCRKANRIVTSIPGQTPWVNHFTVKSYNGWTQFVVRPSEIVGHIPQENKS